MFWDLFNYRRVCEQEGYIHYLEQRLADTEKALEEHAKYSKGLEQQLVTASVELSKYKQVEAGLAQMLGGKKKKKNGKQKETIGFLTGVEHD